MPRALRIEYPGAIYHVMNRGDRREPEIGRHAIPAASGVPSFKFQVSSR